MTEILTDKIRGHIRENIISYILLLVFFAIGTVFGGYIIKTYTNEDTLMMRDFFSEALNIFKEDSPDYNIIFKNTFLESLKTAGFIWLLGFTVIGLPIIFFMTAKVGFMMGFISTFVISFYSYKGILMAVILIFAKCFIFVPLIFVISAYGISLSTLLTKILFGRIKYKTNFKYYILSYITVIVVSLPVIVIYSLAEAYFTANLLSYI